VLGNSRKLGCVAHPGVVTSVFSSKIPGFPG
jgi:hypothetical protein